MSKEQRSIAKAWEVTIRKTKAAAKKRANSLFFTTMSVAHVDDNDSAATVGGAGGAAGEVYIAEKVLSGGDYYTGQWVDKLPNGQGKFLWNDGCMYLGEWSCGKINGKGKFSWGNGDSYEGEFKNGYMDGYGSFAGSCGGSYKGYWVINLRNGNGINCYANGDVYEGDWKKGLQDGNGRYEWKNGNEYLGEWRNGMICGNGSMIWSNGNRYDGNWEDGLPKGKGTFRWEDGSLYVGDWSKDQDEQSGSFYPSSSSSGNIDWDPQEVFDSVLNGCIICPVEKAMILPSQKTFNWLGNEADSTMQKSSGMKNLKGTKVMSRRPRKMSVDGKANNQNLESDQDIASVSNQVSREEVNTRGRPPRLKVQAAKKQGVTICKGHKNYDLMLNLQLGIRHSVGNVGKHSSDTTFDLKSVAFDPKEKVWTKFPPEGSKHTPPHQSSEFKWKDYCPLVFRTLRKLFKVDAADYMLSICGNEALRELSSPGKSGSFFYLTNDDRYMIKTIKKAEAKVLLRMLPAYYKHVRAFENTLVTKFYGLHSVKLTGPAQKKVRFVIMGNLFSSEYAIHRRFDLKGSSQGRQTGKPDSEIEATTTLKDLDLNYIFRLQKVWFQEFCRQVDRDCDLLEQERIMDYSLLIGLHFREASCDDSVTPPSSANGHPYSETASPQTWKVDGDPTRWASITLGINMPARVEKMVRRNQFELVGEPTGELYEVVLFFGIIDILQDYDITKKLEHAYKSFQYDATSISAVDPKQYSKRFRDFIFKVFSDDT